jgi:hypothetical protein
MAIGWKGKRHNDADLRMVIGLPFVTAFPVLPFPTFYASQNHCGKAWCARSIYSNQ